MTHYIALVNQKGGTGKTTSFINLVAAIARMRGRDKVLAIDNDPQSSGTLSFMGAEIAFGERKPGVYSLLEVYEGDVNITDAIHITELAAVPKLNYPASNVHFVPSRIEMSAIETALNTGLDPLFRLKDAVLSLNGQYEFVVLDCPASLGAFTMSALLLCDKLVVPVIPGQFEFSGLRSLMDTIEKVKRFNPSIKIIGVLPTRIKTRTNLAKQAVDDLVEFFGEEVILPAIPDRVAIEESHIRQQDIFLYSPDNDGAASYAAAAESLLNRLGIKVKAKVGHG
ncbi:MAG: ParA family protein [Ardenticatenaceae bacterium]|nr:ParA family protein [Ardenticatenaceae bacterium]